MVLYLRLTSFNPLYWGVLIVTPYSSTSENLSHTFQSSLLRCSHCDTRLLLGTNDPGSFNPLYWGVLIVTSDRISSAHFTCFCFNPLYWGVLIVTTKAKGRRATTAVSILFTEVFLLWLREIRRDLKMEDPEFQSSLLRCSYCDRDWLLGKPGGAHRFNPLYWGVLIVTT